MRGVADDAGSKFEARMAQFENRAQATRDRIDRISPQLDRLSDRIDAAEFQISQKLSAALQVIPPYFIRADRSDSRIAIHGLG